MRKQPEDDGLWIGKTIMRPSKSRLSDLMIYQTGLLHQNSPEKKKKKNPPTNRQMTAQDDQVVGNRNVWGTLSSAFGCGLAREGIAPWTLISGGRRSRLGRRLDTRNQAGQTIKKRISGMESLITLVFSVSKPLCELVTLNSNQFIRASSLL